MELHTLGVDAGYTQQDVIELARILTGWTIDRPQQGGSFVFRPQMHDAGEKVVLGKKFPGGKGKEEGERAAGPARERIRRRRSTSRSSWRSGSSPTRRRRRSSIARRRSSWRRRATCAKSRA